MKAVFNGTKAILKNTSFSGVAAGWFKKVRMGTFFFIFFHFFFSPKKDNIFLPKKKVKGKKTKRPPYWLHKRTPAGPETEVFFRVAKC